MKNLKNLLSETTVTRDEVLEVVEFEKRAYSTYGRLDADNIISDWSGVKASVIEEMISEEPNWNSGDWRRSFVKRAIFLKILRKEPEITAVLASCKLCGIVEVEFIKRATVEQIKTYMGIDNFHYSLNLYAERELIRRKDKELLLLYVSKRKLNKHNLCYCIESMNF